MVVMRFGICILCFVLWVIGPTLVAGQQSEQPSRVKDERQAEKKQLIEELNRVQLLLLLADGIRVGPDGMALTTEQSQAFNELKKERNALAHTFHGITQGSIEEQIEKLKETLSVHQSLEKRLTEEILLPHQAERLRAAEFENLLGRNNNDFLQVIDKFFANQLDFSQDQKNELESINKDANKKRMELLREYKENLEKLNDEIRVEIGDVLTPQQLEILEKITGHKVSKKSAGN